MLIRLEIRFYGRVQGVGFRYQAYHIANTLRLTGDIRNCDDGTVLCHVQGERANIDRMLELLGNGRFIEITGTNITPQTPIPDEREFTITD